MQTRLFHFVGGLQGPWFVERHTASIGAAFPVAAQLDILEVGAPATKAADVGDATWVLRGITSNVRYATRAEQDQLAKVLAPLGRPEATAGALIPIRKSPAWWALSQDQRREIFEERSHHTAASLRFLPAIARRLHHCRDLGPSPDGRTEPFDFLTWFEYAPEHESLFDELVAILRGTEEWKYVDREVDIRVRRE